MILFSASADSVALFRDLLRFPLVEVDVSGLVKDIAAAAHAAADDEEEEEDIRVFETCQFLSNSKLTLEN